MPASSSASTVVGRGDAGAAVGTDGDAGLDAQRREPLAQDVRR